MAGIWFVCVESSASRITLQAILISSSVMISGAAILIASEQCKNQSTITPFSIHLSITALLNSKLFNCKENINPSPRISLISGCINNDRNRLALCCTLFMMSSSRSTFKLAKAAAQANGCPPNVVICPSIGLLVQLCIISFDATNAPIGIPPPIPFASTRMSGIIS